MVGSLLALGLAVAGAGVSAYGKIREGQAQAEAGKDAQAAANAQADLQDYNASVADEQAADAVARGTQAENAFRIQIRQMVGAQRAGFAANNIDVGFGSAVDTQADVAARGELDVLTIRTNAARAAWGYDVQAADLRKAAEITRKEGVNAAAAGHAAETGSFIGAGGALLGTAGSLLASKYGLGKGSQ